MIINKIEQTSFEGKVIAKGRKWPEELKYNFTTNPFLQKASSKGYDIVGRIKVDYADADDYSHYLEEPLYKIYVSAHKENSGFLRRAIYFLGLEKKFPLTRNYHSQNSSAAVINKRANKEFVTKTMNIGI